MSKFLTPTLYKKRSLENQLRNCFYGIHDLICGCTTVQEHIHAILCEPKCLPSTTTTAATTDHGPGEEGFDEGDLDALFAASDDADG